MAPLPLMRSSISSPFINQLWMKNLFATFPSYLHKMGFRLREVPALSPAAIEAYGSFLRHFPRTFARGLAGGFMAGFAHSPVTLAVTLAA